MVKKRHTHFVQLIKMKEIRPRNELKRHEFATCLDVMNVVVFVLFSIFFWFMLRCVVNPS